MVAHYVRAILSVPHDSGLPKDSIANNWAFIVPDGVSLAAAGTEINTRLDAFYTEFNTSLSSQYDWANGNLRIYDMATDEPRVPYYDEDFVLSGVPTTDSDLPAEVALCLSFRAAALSGTNPRRRRGRVYLGPFQVGAGDIPLTPGTMAASIAGYASDHLLNPGGGEDTATWAVYSFYTHHNVDVGDRYDPDNPAHDSDPLELVNAFQPVAAAWVDNAWDTQRRRGVKATSRTTVVVE